MFQSGSYKPEIKSTNVQGLTGQVQDYHWATAKQLQEMEDDAYWLSFLHARHEILYRYIECCVPREIRVKNARIIQHRTY